MICADAAGQELDRAHRLLHMGGPERLSRLDMARLVAQHWHRSPDNILSSSAAAMTDRGTPAGGLAGNHESEHSLPVDCVSGEAKFAKFSMWQTGREERHSLTKMCYHRGVV